MTILLTFSARYCLMVNQHLINMHTVLHKAESRGHANYGWLETFYSFSFANYYNPERINFGALRVLNDDTIHAGKGFGTHPHNNMEIITIPLDGALEHTDSMNNNGVVNAGDVQVMSAGAGVHHSEYNHSTSNLLKLLQIWIFPDKKDVAPRYDQVSIRDLHIKNEFYQVLSPSVTDQGVWIHQQAWFYLADFEAGISRKYSLNNSRNGIYIFVIEGEISVFDQALHSRDGYGIWDVQEVSVETSTNARLLVMEVPMEI